jgi:hypothetical protein
MKEKWIDQFNAEYYSNDHSKENSLFRENLDGYDTKIIDNGGVYGNTPQTMKQKLNEITNARNRCQWNASNKKKELYDIEQIELDEKIEDYEMTISDILDEQLKFYAPKQLLDLLLKEAKAEIKANNDEIDETFEWLTQAIMILTLKATKNKKKS